MGYNIALKLGSSNKTLIGRTQEDLTVTPTVKESITKDDAGQKRSSVTGHEVTFKVSGLMVFDSATTGTTQLDSDEILEQSLKTGSEAEMDCQYYRSSSGEAYTGKVIMTGYSESSNAEDEATYTADLKVTGAFTKVTNQSNP